VSKNNKKLFYAIGYILAITGILFKIYSFTSSITNYPFTIDWSEAGRIFAAYQVYSPVMDGKYLSLPWLDPGRSILDGLVLLIPNVQIWVYRLWESILFLGISCLASVFAIRKVISYSRSPDRYKKGLAILLTLWGMLFLLQGPIYYHVLAGIIPILWFYDEKRPFRNLIIIILCSMWQGLCRVNWFMMPAAIGILLHVLRKPLPDTRLLNYAKWLLIYAVSGGVSSLATYLIYIKATGNIIPFINPSMKYPFLRYKLWPNSGYVGLIPGIVLLSFPVLLVIFYVIWKYRKNLHWIRIVTIMCILGLFFAGGTLVSMRVGGGYDLHNYDTYLILLFITGCFFGLDSAYLDKDRPLEKPLLTNPGVLVLILLIPTIMAYPKTDINTFRENPQSEQTLQEIRAVLQNSIDSQAHQPVLFIDQRQLLVFHMLRDENIYVPYEKIELMEMAMANNQEYKRQFVSDLENDRFSLIISEPLQIWKKHFDPNLFDRDWYENNAWVDSVAIPILDYYTPVYVNEGVAIYAPKY